MLSLNIQKKYLQDVL